MASVEISSSVVASTLYADGTLVARNASLTLPSISSITAELKVGGTVEVPITGQVEAMELAVTFGGPDAGMKRASAMGSHELEARWVQDVMDNEGNIRQVGCKAFFRAYPKGIGGLSLTVGEAGENEYTFGVTRYQVFVDGDEYWCIDQLNNVFRVAGVDYASGISSLL